MADPSLPPSKGLLESLTHLAGTLMAMAHTRLSLIATDVEESRRNLLTLLVLALAAALCLAIGIVLATMVVVFLFWNTHLILALGSLSVFYLLLGLIAWRRALYQARTQTKPFAATLSELSKDSKWLSGR